LLNFGEGRYLPHGKRGAIGYLVGQPGAGLRCMFHMMNEARIGVGLAATMLGLAGYYASLDYARTRTQGRPVGPAGKNPEMPPVRLIDHADIKRMLLAQKAYGEGALALGLYGARLVDELHTGDADQNTKPNGCSRCSRPSSKAGPANGAWKPIAWPFKSMEAMAIHETFLWNSIGAITD
jgi:butyryl-CoA dehydrogenase